MNIDMTKKRIQALKTAKNLIRLEALETYSENKRERFV